MMLPKSPHSFLLFRFKSIGSPLFCGWYFSI